MRIAAQVREHKEAHPEQYCPNPRCLWKTGGGFCPNHGGEVTAKNGIVIKGGTA
jgi:hypothetical protein